jgi:hypothetical protein
MHAGERSCACNFFFWALPKLMQYIFFGIFRSHMTICFTIFVSLSPLGIHRYNLVPNYPKEPTIFFHFNLESNIIPIYFETIWEDPQPLGRYIFFQHCSSINKKLPFLLMCTPTNYPYSIVPMCKGEIPKIQTHQR